MQTFILSTALLLVVFTGVNLVIALYYRRIGERWSQKLEVYIKKRRGSTSGFSLGPIVGVLMMVAIFPFLNDLLDSLNIGGEYSELITLMIEIFPLIFILRIFSRLGM